MKRLTVEFMTVAVGLMATTAAQAVTAQKATGSIRMGTGLTETTEAGDRVRCVRGAGEGEHHIHELRARGQGSGVWAPGAAFEVSFGVDPNTSIVSVYDFTIATVADVADVAVVHGQRCPGTVVWCLAACGRGTISGSTLPLHAARAERQRPAELHAKRHGPDQHQWWVAPRYVEGQLRRRPDGDITNIADVGDRVFSFTTAPTCVDVAGNVTKFGYNIPAGAPLGGQLSAVQVTDGGSSGALKEGTSTTSLRWAGTSSRLERSSAYTQYPITAGNLTVFS